MKSNALPVVMITLGVVLLVGLISFFGSFYVISPGERGVVVTLGKVSNTFSGEGLGFKAPLISHVERVQVKQQTHDLRAECFSFDLQQVNVDLNILFRIPEESVIAMVQKYAGDPFTSLVAPRVQEAVKEVTALSTAMEIAQKREMIKEKSLEFARKKIGDLLFVQDIVINNITLSKELESAIEQKMVQQQEAAKASFTKQKAEMDAQTAVVRAEGESKSLAARAQGEAASIKIRGEALKQNPNVIELMIAEKWNGVSPLVIGSSSGANILLPVQTKETK